MCTRASTAFTCPFRRQRELVAGPLPLGAEDHCIYRLPKETVAGCSGDILVTDAGEVPGEFVVGGAKLVVFHWDATNAVFVRKTIFHPDGFGTGLFEHVCFAPISLPTLPS